MREIVLVHRHLLAVVQRQFADREDFESLGVPISSSCSAPPEDALEDYVASLSNIELDDLRYRIALGALRQYNAYFGRRGD